MLNRKHIISAMVALCLAFTLFLGARVIFTEPSLYDPWTDINDDGAIDSTDLGMLGLAWGSSGSPIDKTGMIMRLSSGCISVPAAAFVPMYSTLDTRIFHNGIYNWDSVLPADFVGDVQLPDGATVTNITYYWYDLDSFQYVSFNLRRYNQTGSDVMSIGTSTGSGGYGSTYDGAVNYATVDNSRWAYTIHVNIPLRDIDPTHLAFNYAVIGYEYQ